eukprot:scaffold58325_cov56-Attheya_sp.AAC.4
MLSMIDVVHFERQIELVSRGCAHFCRTLLLVCCEMDCCCRPDVEQSDPRFFLLQHDFQYLDWVGTIEQDYSSAP